MQVEDCPDSSSDNDSSERLQALLARFDQSPTEAETAAADAIDRLHAVRAKIEEWRKKATPTATDFKHQEDALGQLQVEERILATAVKNLRGDFAGVGDESVPLRRTGVVNRAWIEATKLVGRNFTKSEIEGGWPEALEPHRLAGIQFPQDSVGQSYLNNAAVAACKSGELPCTVIMREDHGRIPGKRDQINVWTDYLIRAHDFACWWFARGESPSVHIAAWLAACGVTLQSPPPREPTASPVGRQRLSVASQTFKGGSPLTTVAGQGAEVKTVPPEQMADSSVPDAPATPYDAAGVAQLSSTWSLKKPKRFQAYGWPLYRLLEAAHSAKRPVPTPREVLDAFAKDKPKGIEKVSHEELTYYDATGDLKSANVRAIKAAIKRMLTD